MPATATPTTAYRRPSTPPLTRDALLRLCEEATAVSIADWQGPHTRQVLGQVGRAWAMLRAGCLFRIQSPPRPGERTFVLELEMERTPAAGESATRWESYLLPTTLALAETNGGDWTLGV